MIRCVAACALILSVLLSPLPAEEKKNPLEGKWKLKAATTGDTDTKLEVGIQLTFDANAVWLNDQKERFKYKVDLNATPALIDITTPDNKEIEGIWEVKGDTLRLCVCSPQGTKFRPTEFHGRDSQILLVLDRVKD